MNICLAADFSRKQDEGFKNIAFNLARNLSDCHKVLKLDPRRWYSPGLWRTIKEFQPHIIHYIPGRTARSFLILKILALYGGNAKTIMSGFQSDIVSVPHNVVTLLKPDLIMTQADEIGERFRSLGCAVEFLPNGVDTGKFRPVSPKTKEELRGKYGIDKEKFVILHVGHLIKERNLHVLSEMQGKNNQVIIVGSLYRKMNHRLYKKLREAGCIVWREYFENIEEVYALADCYIFPTKERYSALMPLSVMEAMACNLPVISIKVEGLSKFLNGGNGLIYVEREEDFVSALDNLKDNNMPINNRREIMPFSWKNVAERLSVIYNEVLNGKSQ